MSENTPKNTVDEREVLSPFKLGWRSFKRDRLSIAGGIMMIILIVFTLFGPFISPYSPLAMHYAHSFESPSSSFFLGTDRFGRDQLSRLIVGTRVSMIVSVGGITLALLIGLLVGLISGYFGGVIDILVMRLVDIGFGFPSLLLALAMVAAFGPSLVNLVIIIGVIFSVRFTRLVRGSVLSIKEKEFIEAIRSVGARDSTIIVKYILPNVISPVIVQATFGLAHAIMIEASMSFIGLGTQPPFPSWGGMLNESRPFMYGAPWLAIFPGLMIIYAVLTFNFLGDGLRDAFDPRISQR